MNASESVSKWKAVELSERSAAQQHFLDLCELLGHPKPAEADPKGDWFTFEKGAAKHGGRVFEPRAGREAMRLTIVLILATALTGCRQAEVREITARNFRVLRIIDGDTFTVTYDGEETCVKLADTSAPGLREPGGPEAREALKKLIAGKVIRIEFVGQRKREELGRLWCRVWLGKMNVGAEMVQRGLSYEEAPDGASLD